MQKEKKVFIVPHSHWDREWYFTIEDSNLLLVENLDYLMDALEGDQAFDSYTFDGQISVIEEYLKIRPEQKERLKKLIKEKRIFVGPWYTQTDARLVHKESIIRNLLYGTRLAKDLGHCMNVGYLPDVFGQNAYLPSMFSEFEIEYSVLQRGVYTDQLNDNLNFMWTSPDGKKVKANNLLLGYGPGKFLTCDDTYYEECLLPMLQRLSDLNKNTNHLLFPSGGDQVLVRKGFTKVVESFNDKDQVHDYVLSDYESFMDEAWAECEFPNEIKGELIGCQKSRIHNTIGSQRYDIKKLNYEVEMLILNILEPLATIGEELGLKYPQAWLDNMWKLLFDVHAHDSIGGCNSDEVNQDILSRLTKVRRMAEGLINIIKKQLTKAISHHLKNENIFVTFNFLPEAYSGMVEATIFTKFAQFNIKNLAHDVLSFDIKAQECVSGGKQVIVTDKGEKEVKIPDYFRTVILFKASAVPPMGYATYLIEESDGSCSYITDCVETMIENESLKVTFNSFDVILTDKQTGTTIENFMTFENVADAGDSYDFSPLEGDLVITLTNAMLVRVEKSSHIERMTLRHEHAIPQDLNDRKQKKDSKTLEIETTLELIHDEAFIRVSHRICNTAHDHRVRVMIKTPIGHTDYSYADQGFSFIKRSTENPHFKGWKEKKFVEAPVPIYILENMVAVCDERITTALLTKGIKEFEVLPKTSQIALTLYRSVGLLGRDDLAWRPGRASGINNKIVHTPGAQLEKEMTFEYCIHLGLGAIKPEKLYALLNTYTTHYTTYQLQTLNTCEERLERFEIPYWIERLEAMHSLFSIDNPNVFMSVCKRSYVGDGIMIRLFNPTDTEQSTHITTEKKIIKTNLFEREQQALRNSITILPKGYITIKLK